MDCTRFREVIFLYTDNELEEEICVSVREHITLCPECAHRIAYQTRLLELLRQRCKKATAPRRLRERILTSLPHRQDSLG